MANRIKQLREASELTLEQVAEVARTTNQQISMLEHGKRKLTQGWMERIAPAFNVAPQDLLPVTGRTRRLRLIGEVQAGVWQEPGEVEDHDGEWISLPVAEHFVKLRPYALTVAGPSMDRVYPEGTILICCHLESLNELPKPGKRYIIQDTDPHGRIESTVKEFVIDEDGRPWAMPRSAHPDYQDPVPLDRGRKGHTIQVKARVIYAIRPE